MASVGDARAASVDGGAQRAGNDDGGKEAAIEKATSIAGGGLLFLLLLAHCGSSRFIKESSEVARGCPARLALDLLLHLAHLPTKPRIKYVVYLLVFFANGWIPVFLLRGIIAPIHLS